MKRRDFVAFAPAILRGARAPGRWLEIARCFADTLLACGLDRLGPKATPAWAGVIDLRSWTVPVSGVPPPRGIRPNDRALGGANRYHDAVTLRVFHALSHRTGDQRYRRAEDDYPRWFLAGRRCWRGERGSRKERRFKDWAPRSTWRWICTRSMPAASGSRTRNATPGWPSRRSGGRTAPAACLSACPAISRMRRRRALAIWRAVCCAWMANWRAGG